MNTRTRTSTVGAVDSGINRTYPSTGLYAAAGTNGGTAACTAGRAGAVPIVFAKGCTVDRIGCNVTATAVGSTVRLGIYNDNGHGRPGTVLLDAGTVDSASGTGTKEITISQALAANTLYWLVAAAQGGAPTCTTAAAGMQVAYNTAANVALSGGVAGVRQDSVTGPFGSWTGTTDLGTGITPRVYVRFA